MIWNRNICRCVSMASARVQMRDSETPAIISVTARGSRPRLRNRGDKSPMAHSPSGAL